jgi:Ion channel
VAFVASVGGIALIVIILWESFETVILPRPVSRRFRLTRLFYRRTWRMWARTIKLLIPESWQETWLSYYGPLSLLPLLSVWAGVLISGFALLYWAIGETVLSKGSSSGFLADLYLSGSTFFTLGMGDVVPGNGTARFLAVFEAGMGFAFLALIISYLPTLNQIFLTREASISLLDARAGSPPTASEMLRRHADKQGMEALRSLLEDWERWSAEFLEGHLAYPVLAYYRSHHDNQSWLAALTAILDTCALIMAGVEGTCRHQAELTFSTARHALIDLSTIFVRKLNDTSYDRLSPEKLAELREIIAAVGIKLQGEEADRRLAELRRIYEPYLHALASYFLMDVPPWVTEEKGGPTWYSSARSGMHRRQKPG